MVIELRCLYLNKNQLTLPLKTVSEMFDMEFDESKIVSDEVELNPLLGFLQSQCQWKIIQFNKEIEDIIKLAFVRPEIEL